MSINFFFVEGTRRKVRRILRSHKIRCTLYTENNLSKLLGKSRDRVATEDKNNIVCGIDCSNCEGGYFGEFKRSLKLHSDELKRSVMNCDCEKNDIAKHCWEADNNFNLRYFIITYLFHTRRLQLIKLRELFIFASVKLYNIISLISRILQLRLNQVR